MKTLLEKRPVIVKHEKIVVIEDESDILEVIAYNLKREGFEVYESQDGEDGGAILDVEDDGIGIAPADQNRIFERFYRVDKARSRELGGTGLGLSIVKHVALSHGGNVSLRSALGAGSNFRVQIPPVQI